MSGPVESILERFLSRVRDGCPAAWSRIAEGRDGLVVSALVDDEAFCVSLGGGGARTCGASERASVRLEARASVVRDLVLGDDDVIGAATHGRLSLYGSAADLARLDEAVRWMVAGAARASGTAALLDELIDVAARERGADRAQG